MSSRFCDDLMGLELPNPSAKSTKKPVAVPQERDDVALLPHVGREVSVCARQGEWCFKESCHGALGVGF